MNLKWSSHQRLAAIDLLSLDAFNDKNKYRDLRLIRLLTWAAPGMINATQGKELVDLIGENGLKSISDISD